MSIEGQKFYPGEAASPQQVAALAGEYRQAADALLANGRRGEPLSLAPYRFVAIHAVELYLNAMLLLAGHSPVELRRMHHDLASRTELAVAANLRLRRRTLLHLQALSQTREYLATRYDPAASETSQLNRLAATLTEVAQKVTVFVQPAGLPPKDKSPGP